MCLYYIYIFIQYSYVHYLYTCLAKRYIYMYIHINRTTFDYHTKYIYIGVLYHVILCYRPSLFTSLPFKSTKFHVKFPKLKGVNVSHQVGFFSGNCTQKATKNDDVFLMSHVRTCVFFCCVSIVLFLCVLSCFLSIKLQSSPELVKLQQFLRAGNRFSPRGS